MRLASSQQPEEQPSIQPHSQEPVTTDDTMKVLTKQDVKKPSLETLLETLRCEKSRFDDESKKHKHLFRKDQTTVIILTTMTTVVAGIGLLLPRLDKNVVQFFVICLTATTTAVISWNEMRRARELWQHEREVYHALLDIEREIAFFSGTRELSLSDIDEYFKRISEVIGSSLHKWARIQEKKG